MFHRSLHGSPRFPRAASLAMVALASVGFTATAGCSADAPPAAPAAQAEAVQAEPQKADPAPAAAPEKAPLTETKFGEPVSPGAVVSLASIAADPTKYAGKQVKTEGVVKAVCKKAGCWMEIEGDLPGGEQAESGRAHVKMAGHSFYVPKNCDGHRAVVEGTVKAGAPEDTCASKDSCGGSENGAVARLEIAATGVEFVD